MTHIHCTVPRWGPSRFSESGISEKRRNTSTITGSVATRADGTHHQTPSSPANQQHDSARGHLRFASCGARQATSYQPHISRLIHVGRRVRRASPTPAFSEPTASGLTSLTHMTLASHMRKLLHLAGLNPLSYAGHSFNRGGGEGCTTVSFI